MTLNRHYLNKVHSSLTSSSKRYSNISCVTKSVVTGVELVVDGSRVESPDMKNVYDGVVALDDKGEAVKHRLVWCTQ